MPLISETIGFVASTLVLTTFAMNDMRMLRIVAVVSNVAFIAYGALSGLPPVLCLHLLLLPLNLVRLRQMQGPQRWSRSFTRPSQSSAQAWQTTHAGQVQMN